jgi:multicomponent K+:H+ antiporter subunit G
MTGATDLPVWVACVVALLVLVGAALTLIGCAGLLRLPTFFQRIHAPTLGTTLGTGAILIASMLFFTAAEFRPVLHEILIAVFMTITTPVSFILLAKAARQRGEVSSKPEEADRTSHRT